MKMKIQLLKICRKQFLKRNLQHQMYILEKNKKNPKIHNLIFHIRKLEEKKNKNLKQIEENK